jgi:hypothetical protein
MPPDAFVPNVDPTGNWSIDYAFGSACGNAPTTQTGVFTVTVGSMGYQILVAGVSSTGVLACDPTECRVSGTWAWEDADTAYQQSMNLTLAVDGAVTGDGTQAVVTETTNCTYPFTVTGERM